MKIHEVQENLKNTIAGKEQLLEEYKKASMIAVRNDTPDRATIGAMAGFLSVNIDELKRILQDVDKAVEQYNELAWTINPDRSGGAFTDEEIARSSEWR